MLEPIIVVLGLIGKKVFDTLLSEGISIAVDSALASFSGDKVQKAFECALGEAIRRYASSGTRFAIAKPLLQRDGPLAGEPVAKELAHVLRFDREPNYKLIGDRWRASLSEPLPHAVNDFTAEARTLVKYLREELQASEMFGPVFDHHNLAEINEHAEETVGALAAVADELGELRQMMNAAFGNLMRSFVGASVDIHSQIRDFTTFIEEKTIDFVGRQFVFDRVAGFMANNPRGYFVLRGDPGIGKSALAAHLVKTQGYLHHFNIRALGINRSEAFLRNICAQIIATHRLDYDFLPSEVTHDGGFLLRILSEAAERLKPGEKIVLVVDALDEVDDAEARSGSNVLFLPPLPPDGVYFIVTARRVDLPLRIECQLQEFFVQQDSHDNLADIRAYVKAQTRRPTIQRYIEARGLAAGPFSDQLIDKSQGNFIYLRYVLPEIAQGAYQELATEDLPLGLRNYYEDHWRRMRGLNEEAWLEYKLPVVIALSIVMEPVSIDLLADFSGVKDRRKINAALNEWRQFLYERTVEYEVSRQKRWRVYHDSFREFIASKDEVRDEYVSLRKAYGLITDDLWGAISGKKEP